MEASEASLAIRAAWLYYVHGMTQAQVAKHLAMSRVKVHRLIARAHQQNWVKVFVEGSTAEGIALEQRLKETFRLAYCCVAPSAVDGAPEARFRSVGAAGALYLHQYLEQNPQSSIGVGHGRTLAAVADALPRLARPKARFVSILGSLTRHSTANPFDVIYRFAERTGGDGYFIPAPFFVDSVDDAEIFRGQRVVQSVLDLARKTDLVLVGIGNLRNAPAIYESERKTLAALGVVGELLGQFLDAEGRVVDCDMAQRAISLRLEALRGRPVIGIAEGLDKAVAIRATLRSGLLSGLITDEATAGAVLSAKPASGPTAKRSRAKAQAKGPRARVRRERQRVT
jgi:DNA-binding transcriptional regulator LsrR (DeoR family)